MKPLGIVLVILGVLALIYGGFNYTRERTVIDVGPLKATATEHRTLPISPIVGAVAIVGGLLLIVAQQRKA
jgi:uncharacterized membrane protein YidH (DUF202 family)